MTARTDAASAAAQDAGSKPDGAHAARLERERRVLEAAWEDVRAGRIITDADVDLWRDQFDRGEPLFTGEA